MVDLSRWPEADRWLDGALGLPADERHAYLERVAGHEPELLRQLALIVAEADDDAQFLAAPRAFQSTASGQASSTLPALTPRTRIEHYEVVELIGRGGMGEVYRARDTRLHRDVALKVLPLTSAADADRRARFAREARVLAMVSHPGIAAIYGVAEADDVEALVLELVDGPTLADRLAASALSLDHVVTIAKNLIDAIAAAHARGVLHRDLKPANIKVSRDGAVKVLDFGLAKALAPLARGSSPDLTDDRPRALLGTAAYMSPEQIRGGPVDARTDIWALGCVLFEMLTGSRAFPGDSVPEVLARVMERQPAFNLLPPSTPPSLRRLLRRTLEKDPQRRLGLIADARLELDDVSSDDVSDASPRARGTAVAVAVGALALGVIAGVLLTSSRTTSSARVSRFVIPFAPGESPVAGFQPLIALSPDGRTLVYRARRDGVTRLYRRDADALDATPIADTENATGPFFSPDGRWLGFDGDGVLKRVALAGGDPVAITAAPGGVTASWGADDAIVFATNTTRVLQRVAASGGPVETLTRLDVQRGDTQHAMPQVIAGGRQVLFTIAVGAARHVALLDRGSGAVRSLVEGAHGRLLPTNHLLFARGNVLWAVRVRGPDLAFDGPALPIVDRVEHSDNTVLHFDAAADGSLVYLPEGQLTADLQRFVWIDRQGRITPVDLPPRPYTRMSLSPDATQLAVAVNERGNTDIWIGDLRRGTTSRLTMDPTIETMPTWSPDGLTVAFRSEREGPGVFRRDAQGAGPIDRLTSTDGPIHSPYSWTPDGRTLLLALFRSFNRQAIASVSPPDPTVRVLLDGEFAQLDPHVSPDGRWLAYQSDESGRFEIYVRPYPNVREARWQVSSAGGSSPRWGPDGRELFYYDGASLVRVPVITAAASFASGAPAPIFAVEPFGGRLGPDFEIAPDGQRFLFIVPAPAGTTATPRLLFVQNWASELEARLRANR